MLAPSLRTAPSSPGLWAARAALVLAALPVVAGPNGWFLTGLTTNPYDHQRVMMVAGLLAVACLLLISSPLRTESVRVWNRATPMARWMLALFFTLGLASAARAPLAEAAFLEWGMLLLATVSVIAIAGIRNTLGKEADLALLALVITAVAVYTGDFLAFYLPTVPVPDVSIFWGSPFFHFLNVRFFNQFQTWTLPLLAGGVVVAAPYSRLLAGLLGLVGSFWWGLLFATGGRGTLIAAALSTLLTVLFLQAKALRWAGTSLALVAGGLVFYFLLFDLPGAAPGMERAVEKSGRPDQARFQLWTQALESAANHPFLGIGPMQSSAYGHPHNALFQIASEWGMPATAAATGLVATSLWGWLRRWNARTWRDRGQHLPWEVALVPALTASILAGLGHAMVSGTLVMPVSQTLAILVAGWILGIYQNLTAAGGSFHSETGNKGEKWVAIATLAGFVALAPGFVNTLRGLSKAHETYSQQEGGPLTPRFWSQGDLCLPPWSRGNQLPFCAPISQPKESDL